MRLHEEDFSDGDTHGGGLAARSDRTASMRIRRLPMHRSNRVWVMELEGRSFIMDAFPKAIIHPEFWDTWSM